MTIRIRDTGAREMQTGMIEPQAIDGVQGGQPITRRGSISTAAIYDRWLGGESPWSIAKDYGIHPGAVLSAVHFEAGRAWADGGRKKWRKG